MPGVSKDYSMIMRFIILVWSIILLKRHSQNDQKRDVCRQLLGVAHMSDGRIFAINLDGDMCFWKDGAFSSERRHITYINAILQHKGDLVYSSEKDIFHVGTADKKVDKVASKHSKNVKALS